MNIHECPSAGDGTHWSVLRAVREWLAHLPLPVFMAGGDLSLLTGHVRDGPQWLLRERRKERRRERGEG